MKKEAKDKAASIFLEADGKISNVEVATRVGVNPLTIGKWKKQDAWESKLRKARAEGRAKEGPAAVRKRDARDQAAKIYIESEGKITNKALADRIGVSPATISNWKIAEGWREQLKQRPEPSASEPETIEEPVAVAPVSEPEKIKQTEEIEEIEIDLDELAFPDHITLLNKRIDEMLARGYLSPIDLKTVAEAKEAVLRAVGAYIELLAMAAED